MNTSAKFKPSISRESLTKSPSYVLAKWKMKAKRNAKSRRCTTRACSKPRLDYHKAKPNRFAGRSGKNCTVVELDDDVSEVFSDSQSVNTALRAFISAIPRKAR